MYCGRENTCALFGCIGDGSIVKNITVESSSLDESELNGFICAYNEGTVEHCINRTDAHLLERSAGICAVNGYNGKIFEAINHGHISGEVIIGGICGFNFGLIDNCLNEGKINDGDIVNGTRMGGIAAVNYGSIRLSGNTGNITGAGTLGGIAGINTAQFGTDANITACWNEGTITGRTLTTSDVNDVGGIVGSNNDAVLSASINRGSVNGVLYVGGVCGYHYRNTIISCYNEGVVSGQEYVAGVVGYIGSDEDNPSVLISSYNVGEVNSTHSGDYIEFSIASVCGYAYGIVNDCWYTKSDKLTGIATVPPPDQKPFADFSRTAYEFSASSWPTSDIAGWGIGAGDNGAFWKSLGQYTPGGTPDSIKNRTQRIFSESFFGV